MLNKSGPGGATHTHTNKKAEGEKKIENSRTQKARGRVERVEGSVLVSHFPTGGSHSFKEGCLKEGGSERRAGTMDPG